MRGDRLRSGNTKACAKNGHRWLGWIEERGFRRKGEHQSEYKSWESMFERCCNKKHASYPRYGGRGIKICARWSEFKNFLADMGVKPTPKHTIDRYPNQEGNYEPENCRWATQKEQSRNKRNNVKVVYQGREMLLLDVISEIGVPRNIIYARIKNGWTIDEALGTPLRPKRKKRLDIPTTM